MCTSIQLRQQADLSEGQRTEPKDVNRRAVAERCGMVREGHLRENKRPAGSAWSGMRLYGLLRGEFGGAP